MLISIVAVGIGAAVLAVGADQFVVGAARSALIRRVPRLVVGVVIIGFGTSAPELLVSGLAAIQGESGAAIGNIVGSNIANLTLLLGLGAIIVPLAVSSRAVKREAPLVVGAVALFAVFVQGGGINGVEGVILLCAMGAALFIVVRPSQEDPLGTDTEDFADPGGHRLPTEVLRTVFGLAATIAGAQILLSGALDIASELNLSEGFVGATLVAVGTSLPELVTVIQSARRKETDLIVGNLLGSNLFNALVAGGIVGLIGAPSLDAPNLTVIAAGAAVIAAAVALFLMVSDRKVSRWEGAALVGGYLLLVPFLA